MTARHLVSLAAVFGLFASSAEAGGSATVTANGTQATQAYIEIGYWSGNPPNVAFTITYDGVMSAKTMNGMFMYWYLNYNAPVGTSRQYKVYTLDANGQKVYTGQEGWFTTQ